MVKEMMIECIRGLENDGILKIRLMMD